MIISYPITFHVTLVAFRLENTILEWSLFCLILEEQYIKYLKCLKTSQIIER